MEQGNLIDNWDVMGLRGTGSIDYTIDGVHVDEAWCHSAVISSRLAAAGSTSWGSSASR